MIDTHTGSEDSSQEALVTVQIKSAGRRADLRKLPRGAELLGPNPVASRFKMVCSLPLFGPHSSLTASAQATMAPLLLLGHSRHTPSLQTFVPFDPSA